MPQFLIFLVVESAHAHSSEKREKMIIKRRNGERTKKVLKSGRRK
jgi:hypothetical protein